MQKRVYNTQAIMGDIQAGMTSCSMTVSNMVSSPGAPDWWTIYVDLDADTYDPQDPRVAFHDSFMSLESLWAPYIDKPREWEDELIVGVDLAGLCGAMDPGHEFHDLLREGPEQCLALIAAATHRVTSSLCPVHGMRTLCC